MALDSAVAPASSPRSSRPVQSRASAWFRTVQQVFDEDALAPGHEGRRHGMLGQLRHRLDGVAGIAAFQAALAGGHAQPEHAGLGQPGQDRGGILGAFVQRLGMRVQPVAQLGRQPGTGAGIGKRLRRRHCLGLQA